MAHFQGGTRHRAMTAHKVGQPVRLSHNTRRDGYGLETRERGTRYYTRTRRVNGRRVREYVGRGLIGELAAREDAARRAAQSSARESRQREREAERQLRELVATIDRQAMTLTTITLTAAGYHRPKRGIWRRRRDHGTR